MKRLILLTIILFVGVMILKGIAQNQNALVSIPSRFTLVYEETINGVSYTIIQDSKTNSNNACLLILSIKGRPEEVPSIETLPGAACQ